MVSLRSISVFLALLLAPSVSAGPAMLSRDQPYDYAVNTTSRQPAQQTITVTGAKFLTIHFSQFALAEGDVVSLSDASGAVVAEYSGLGRGSLGDKGGFYSSQVFSSSVTVQYKPSPLVASSGDFGFKIDKIVRNKPSASVSTVCSANQSEPPKCYSNDTRAPQASAQAQAVARLYIAGEKYCTGWLLGSEGHLVTNFHCIANQFDATNTNYEFGAESSSCDQDCGGPGGCKGTIVATTATYLAGDKALDYAIVKLNASVDLTPYGHLKLRVAGGVDQEQIYIPQHPKGRAKMVAVMTDGGDVIRAAIGVSNICGTYRVGYDADTEDGSSGSPVIATKDNAVIGLHSCGVANGADKCVNSGLDVRALIHDLKSKNVLPVTALDDPNAQLPVEGPWLPATPAPGPVTPAPTVNICLGFRSKTTCEVFTKGKCRWINNTSCDKNPDAAATPAPPAPTPILASTTAPSPTNPKPTTPSPATPTPTTPAPTTPAPTTPAAVTPSPTAKVTSVPMQPPVTPTPMPLPTARDQCSGFSFKISCQFVSFGKCKWVDSKCSKK